MPLLTFSNDLQVDSMLLPSMVTPHRLTALELFDMKVKHLSAAVKFMQCLNFVGLSGNDVCCIPKAASHNTQLVFLDLSSNKESQLEEQDFGVLAALPDLHFWR